MPRSVGKLANTFASAERADALHGTVLMLVASREASHSDAISSALR
ncbi:MAG TPA: hypothetical protein VN903_30660 [Polyangia bacterium]|nr:hypothetical protein [Polyangia bacterium]